MIRALLMDVGNVVVRLKTRQFLVAVSGNCKGMTPEDVLEEIRHPDAIHIKYEKGEVTFDDFHAWFQKRWGMTWNREQFLQNWNDYFLPNKPMEITLAKMRGQVKIWGLSNTNAEHHSHYRRMFRVFDLFERVIGSQELGLRKPDPEIFKQAIEIVGSPAGEILFLDDMKINVEAAQNCGMHGFHYTFNDAEFRQTLKDFGFDLDTWENRPSNMAC